MALKGNKGEWSEIYTLFRLLGEGKVHAGDANLNKLATFYPIIKIIREDTKHFEYSTCSEKQLIIIDEEGNEYARIPMKTFLEESETLLHAITSSKETTFEVSDAEKFMGQIGCSKIKAPSKDKSDIHIVIHDLRTSMNHELGFSIKSQLGSPSTLLNAGESTNITYYLSDSSISNEEINEINAIEDHLPRMKAIIEKGYQLHYYDVEHQTFKNNLLFLDTCMPEFIAECLLCDILPASSHAIKDAVEIVAQKNPLKFPGDAASFYKHKMKVLLIDAALGMTPAKEWKGQYDANGGYLVVKTNGDIVCYHFYNRNDVEDYLFNNTRFERASRSRYKFGSLYRGEDGRVYIKLNLQIRFNK